MSHHLAPWRFVVVVAALGNLLGLVTACTQAPRPPAPPPGPDLARISAVAREAVGESFTEVGPSPIAPCELRSTAHVRTSGERGRTVALKAPAQLTAGRLDIFYAIYPAPDTLLDDLARIAQACQPRKVTQVLTPQGKLHTCHSDVATTVVMDGSTLTVITKSVLVPAPGADWKTNEKGLLVPPPDFGKPTCGTGVSYGQANAFAASNGLAVQVIKPIDLAETREGKESPTELSTAAQTTATAAIQKILVALPS
ncbi:hypothetical protein [Kibdelosporangium phytohabitans]|nr:hypothetical protein [Kibdelosporangium phytohabitans]MBE1470849.1 hypothetical protein [Kibdelosporangium phytohabitans]